MVWKTNFDRNLNNYVVTDVEKHVGKLSETNVKEGPLAGETVLGAGGPKVHKGGNQSGAGKKSHGNPKETVSFPGGRGVTNEHVQAGVPLNLQDVPVGLAVTLQHMASQVDLLTQTMTQVEERMTLNEDRTRNLEQKLDAVLTGILGHLDAAKAPTTQGST
jgi:hypothetical protein